METARPTNSSLAHVFFIRGNSHSSCWIEDHEGYLEALQTNFASQSKAKMMHNRMQLQNTKKANMPMQDYLNKMKSCIDFLGAAGSVISEHDQILFILGGLSQDYNSILVS